MNATLPYADARSRPWYRRAGVVAVAAVVAVVAAGGYWALSDRPAGDGPSAVIFHAVALADLDVTVRQEGELQAVDNIDIVCPVPGASTVKSVVAEGTRVGTGDLILELDDSEIATNLEQATLDVRKAESDLTAAREGRAIQVGKNEADRSAAEVELRLARLSLVEYAEGEYPKKLGVATRALTTARSELADKVEYLGQTRTLFVKDFTTAGELKKAEFDADNKRSAVEDKRVELEVLGTYTHERELAEKQDKVSQAELKVANVAAENASTLSQKVAAEQTAEQTLGIHTAALERLRKDRAACRIVAPAPGIVIYGTSVGSYYRNDQPLAVGSEVVQQQMLIRLPDVTAMKAVVKLLEDQVVGLRSGGSDGSAKRVEGEDGDASAAAPSDAQPFRATVEIAGVEGPVGGTVTKVAVLPDADMRWMNPDLKQYPVDVALDRTPPGLKPGASATVTVHLARHEGVIAVPFAAVYSSGGKAWAFVRRPGAGSGTDVAGAVEPRGVTLGPSNATHVVVTAGLSAGDAVLLLGSGEGRRLLDRAGVTPDAPAPTPAPPA